MVARCRSLLTLGFIAALSIAPRAAHAQDEEEGTPPEAGEETAAEDTPEEAAAPTTPVSEPPSNEPDADSPIEKKGQTYHFVGLRYRGVIVPKFMMNLFGDGGTTVYVDAFGPEFTIRKDQFEYVFSLWYADYGMDDTPFKASDDEEEAWEIVNSEIKVVYLTADFLWTHQFTPEWGLNYGMGAGFGLVFGDLSRVQAYSPTGAPADPEDYRKCSAPGVPDPNYCGSDNEHYGDYTEPSWADGGSKPIIFPWLALQTGLRFKPHRNFMGRLDLGFGLSGFFVGLGANYGL